MRRYVLMVIFFAYGLLVNFLVKEEGNVALAHHLLKVLAFTTVLASAGGSSCRLVVGFSSSRTNSLSTGS
jgi:hypothetical protein